MPGLLSIEPHGDVAVVTLQRPEKRNALSIDLRLELADAFEHLARDDSVACIVLTGAGTAFCSGMDTSQFGGDLEHRRRLVETSTGAFHAVGRCPKPVVAAVNGPALAGGFALALLCDVRIASERATFGYPELPIGIPPSYAAARAALSPGLARELCLTGRVVEAAEAARLGIVSEVCDVDALPGVALAQGEAIARMPRAAIIETKRRILFDGERTWGALFDEEERVFRAALARRGARAGGVGLVEPGGRDERGGRRRAVVERSVEAVARQLVQLLAQPPASIGRPGEPSGGATWAGGCPATSTRASISASPASVCTATRRDRAYAMSSTRSKSETRGAPCSSANAARYGIENFACRPSETASSAAAERASGCTTTVAASGAGPPSRTCSAASITLWVARQHG